MLKIRLQRVGKKNQASFRIVLAEKHRAAAKKVTEVLGFYNPRSKQFGIKNPERLQYWISQHVEISPTMNNLLIDKGLLKGEKVKAWRPRQKPQTAADKTPEVKAEVPAVPTGRQAQAENQAPSPQSSPVQGEKAKVEAKPEIPKQEAPAVENPK